MFMIRYLNEIVSAVEQSVCYLVSEWTGVDWVFSGQRDTAEENEEENDVGEGGVVDDPVAKLPQPFNRKTQF